MTPNEYQQLALRTENTPATIDGAQVMRLLHGAIGLCTEAGELQDMLKKHLFYGAPLDLVNVVEEIGDLLWYAAIALDAAGSSMDDAMRINISKLQVRYPSKFTAAAAMTRDLAAERAVLEGAK